MCSDVARIRDRMLAALGAARVPGFHFPGHLLDIRWSTVAPEHSELAMSDAPHLRNATGEVDLLAICVLADVALGTAARALDWTTRRLSTIHLQLQFTGVPMRGNIHGEARLLGEASGTALQQRLVKAKLSARGAPVCHVSGELVALDAPPGITLGALPWHSSRDAQTTAAIESTLSDAERDALRRCDAALVSSDAGFLEQFWLGSPSGLFGDRKIVTGVHTGNRVGHVQGGLLVGFAARVANDVVPPKMRLSNVSAWYLSPGRGTLHARTELLHRGRNTALVRSVLASEGGETVLEAMSQYIAVTSG